MAFITAFNWLCLYKLKIYYIINFPSSTCHHPIALDSQMLSILYVRTYVSHHVAMYVVS